MRPGWQPARDPQRPGAAQDRARRAWSPSTRLFVAKHPDSKDVRTQLGPRARRRAQARRGARAVPRGREARAARIRSPRMRWGCCRCSSRTSPTPQAAFKRALELGYRDTSAVYLEPRPGRRGPEEVRRGHRLVPQGGLGRLGARPAEDRHPGRAPAGPRRRPRVPAEDRAAHARGPDPDDPGRGAAAARREGLERDLRHARPRR